MAPAFDAQGRSDLRDWAVSYLDDASASNDLKAFCREVVVLLDDIEAAWKLPLDPLHRETGDSLRQLADAFDAAARALSNVPEWPADAMLDVKRVLALCADIRHSAELFG